MQADNQAALRALTDPHRLFTRAQVIASPCPVPSSRGVYAWYFREIPGDVATEGCVIKDGLTLLYVGISPQNDHSSQNLRKRITYHYRGNAEGSTLRLTLGALLTAKSDCPLRRVGSGKRLTFTHVGEQWLDAWMADNASVCWVEHSEPWLLELAILGRLSLPLNIQDNGHHPHASVLSEIRRAAKATALAMPIASEGNQRRAMAPGGL